MTLNKETSNEGFENKLSFSVLLFARRLAKYKEKKKKLASRRYNSTLRFARQYCACRPISYRLRAWFGRLCLSYLDRLAVVLKFQFELTLPATVTLMLVDQSVSMGF